MLNLDFLEKSEKAFRLINFNESDPINKENFYDIIKGCELFHEPSEDRVSALFSEIDKDEDNLVSLSDFLERCGSDISLAKHIGFVDSIIAKEQEIILYKKNKAKALRESKDFC